MSKKKKQTSSKSHLKIPLYDTHSSDITYCDANCRVLCARRKVPKGYPFSMANLSTACLDYKERK